MQEILRRTSQMIMVGALAASSAWRKAPRQRKIPRRYSPPSEQTQEKPGKSLSNNKIRSVPKNTKEDVEAVGNRSVGKGINFYSLEKEIALGKGLAQEVERSSKMIDDPVVTEYVNRVGQNLVRNSDARRAVYDQGDRFGMR
jgi:hypothetical protein